jgi:hypothetical protein
VALAVDASSPARASGANTNGTLTITTASFTPPAGSVLVATVQSNDRNAGAGATGAVTNSGTALTWTKVAERNILDSGGNSGYAGLFVAVQPTSVAMTATFTLTPGTGGSATVNTPTIKLYVVTGADTTTPVGGSAEGSSTTNNLTTTAFTTVGASSLGFVSSTAWIDTGVGAPTSADCTYDAFDGVGGSIDALSGYKTLGTAGSSATFNLDDVGTAAGAWNWVSVEIKAAPVVPSGRIPTGLQPAYSPYGLGYPLMTVPKMKSGRVGVTPPVTPYIGWGWRVNT